MINEIKSYLLDLQNRICQFIEQEDTEAHFAEDEWTYKNGKGGGKTRVLQNGKFIEKAGVNFSHVKGEQLPIAATNARPELKDIPFDATGISVVVHSSNPFVPTSHMNVRYIQVNKPNEPIWWMGGGFDLTPYYGFSEDCLHWHKMAKEACDPFGTDIYPKFKKWADRYFFLPHRNEPRGIGGIFFDDLNEWPIEKCFNFIKNVGDHYIKAYQPILAKRKKTVYTREEREFQLFRRGRYVEFNLLYDRGTLFGLQSQGRVESILMSLPPQVSWPYNYQIMQGSKEEKFYREFLTIQDWI